MRGYRSRRRSGISNLVGAIFFVLVVGLVVSTLTVIFGVSAGFIGSIHTSNSVALNNENTEIDISNMTFGGTYASTPSTPITVSSSPTVPLLPITDMNFTGGDSGWYVSHGFSILRDNATVSNTNSSDVGQLPASAPFSLVVKNNDVAPGRLIQKVTVLADENTTASCPMPQCTFGLPFGTTVTVTGNNITWAIPSGLGITQGSSDTFYWSAVLPANLGTFYDTVVVSWYSSATSSFLDTGIATVNANTTTTVNDQDWLSPGTSTGVVQGTHSSFVPGGLTAGYDGDALTTQSDSGPGSIYVDFQPTVNSAPIPSGDQLMGVVNFTTTFTLQSDTPVSSSGCCAVSLDADLTALTSTHNPLVYYRIYLQNTSKVWVVMDPGGTNPTLLNYFGPTGWQFTSEKFSPSSSAQTLLQSGAYNLTISVSMTMPSGSPSEVAMNFDDIGLSITPNGADSYGSQQLQLDVQVPQAQVQGLTVDAEVSATVPPTTSSAMTAYLFAGDDATGTMKWAEIGSASFNNATNIMAVIPLPQAAYYVNDAGELNLLLTVVSPVSCAGIGCPGVTVSVYAVTATTDQNQSVVTVQATQGSQPVKLAAMYISGPNGLTNMPLNTYVVGGDVVVIPTTNFTWVTGQTYTVTLTTTNGLTFARSFVAPEA